MRMTPIVAVVDEPTLAAVREMAESRLPVTPEVLALMGRNGWTDESLMAGIMIAAFVHWQAATPEVS